MEKPFLITHTFTINVAYINHGTVGTINVFSEVSSILVKILNGLVLLQIEFIFDLFTGRLTFQFAWLF